MSFLRSYLPFGGNSTGGQDEDVERQGTQDREQGPPRRFQLNRPQLPVIFARQSHGVRRLERRRTTEGGQSEGSKKLKFGFGSRTWARATSRSPSPAQIARSSTDQETPAAPDAAHVRRGSRSSGRRRFDGADPAEMQLADMADEGRRRRRRREQRSQNSEDDRDHPKHFMFCFPWIKSTSIRRQILKCFVSGLFLLLSLAVYLILTLTKDITSTEFTILLILLILFATIIFCHGLIRLCLIIMRRNSPHDEETLRRGHMAEIFGHGGYAVPRRPIRIVMTRDEEAAGLESEEQAGKVKPPAYGAWRQSVRVDPNRIYWQRNEETRDESGAGTTSTARPTTANRPPSYASDDGVEYVVEARPRSMAPATLLAVEQLREYPSEVGEVGQTSAR